MTLRNFFTALFLSTVAFTSHADSNSAPLCSSMKDCRDLRDRVNAQIVALREVEVPKLADVAKEANRPLLMGLDQATEYCKKLGSRLPTSREYAMLAKNFGAFGVTKDARDPSILSLDFDGADDTFQYRNDGYHNSNGDDSNFPGNYMYWTSSRNSFETGDSWAFDAANGELDYVRAFNKSYATRCIANP